MSRRARELSIVCILALSGVALAQQQSSAVGDDSSILIQSTKQVHSSSEASKVAVEAAAAAEEANIKAAEAASIAADAEAAADEANAKAEEAAAALKPKKKRKKKHGDGQTRLPYIENFNKMKKGKSTWLEPLSKKCPETTACRKKGCVKMIKDPKKQGKTVMEVKYKPSAAKYLSTGPGIRGVCAPTPIMSGPDTEFKGVMRASTSFRVFFKKGFDFSKGAKLGTGFRGGTKKAVGCAAKSPDGFSHRVMWRNDGVLESYIYHAGRKNKCGDVKFANWKTRTGVKSATTANNFKFKTGRWYTVTQSMVLNDPPEAFNGVSAVYVDGNLMIQTTGLQWRGNPDKRKNLIDKVKFGTFYGGKDASWQPASTTTALYDDIVVYPEASDDNVKSPLTYCMGGKKKGSKCCKKRGRCRAKASCASFWDTNCKIPKLPKKNF